MELFGHCERSTSPVPDTCKVLSTYSPKGLEESGSRPQSSCFKEETTEPWNVKGSA